MNARRGRAIASVEAIGLPIAILLLALGTAALTMPEALEAQQRVDAALGGVVVSAMSGEPVEGAAVVLPELERTTVTNAAGRFHIDGVPAGQHAIRVRRLGFADRAGTLAIAPADTTEVRLVLEETALRIEELTVTAEAGFRGRLADFERRRRTGRGHYITPEDIAGREPRFTSDLLRTVPGLRVSRSVLGRATLWMSRHGDRCEPVVFLDGKRAPGVHVDDLNAPDVLAIEIYRGPAEMPPELERHRRNCGAIVIWTRVRTGGPGRRP